jgi:dipeptidyl aminopeptidase/acylaminoacyl peptidase
VLLVLVAFAGPSSASFPGRNGTIVYGWIDAQKYEMPPTSIRAVNPRSGRRRVLTDCPHRASPLGVPYAECIVAGPRFSPNGRTIAYPTVQVIPATTPGHPWEYRPGIGMMAASDGTRLEERATVVEYQWLAWSPAGNQFLLQRVARRGISSTKRHLSRLARWVELTQVTPEWTGSPDWSTTGDIAFTRYADPSCLPRCEDIWVTRLGGTPHQLTFDGGFNPSWSPHGTKLAFAHWTRDGQADVHLIGKDGRGRRRLTYRGGLSPTWSPDGKWIAFIRENDLYIVRTTGRGLRRVVNAPPVDEVYGLGPQVVSIDWQARPRR